LCTRMLCTADVSAATTAKSRPTTPMTHSIAAACRRLLFVGEGEQGERFGDGRAEQMGREVYLGDWAGSSASVPRKNEA
jgi:hypothetical protein